MKKFVLYICLGLFMASSVSSCKAKHCIALEDGMEGFNPRKIKKKRGRQEGLFGKKTRR